MTEAVSFAINNPAGKLIEQLFSHLWPKHAKVGGGLPKQLTDRFERAIRRGNHDVMDASSIIIASRLEVLFAVAPSFAREFVIPLLDWNSNPSAAAYWSGFLWPARISPDLFNEIEEDCVRATQSPDMFEPRAYEVLCQIFQMASMEFKASNPDIIHAVLDNIGPLGLGYVTSFIRQRLLNTKDDAAHYWKGTVRPWLDIYWPREAESQIQSTKEDFAMIALYSDDAFPDALHWMINNGVIGEVPTHSTILYSLRSRDQGTHEDFKKSSTLPERFPGEVLELLHITRPFQWDHGYGREVLTRIVNASPDLAESHHYQELVELLPAAN